MRKKTILFICLGLLLIGSFYWVYITQSTIKQEAKKPIKIGIIVYPGAGLFYVAQDKGFFKEEGVKTEIVQIPDENQIVSSLASNQIQMFYSTADFSTIIADARVDAPEVFISDMSYGADGLVVKNNVIDISQLKGKKVYLSIGTPSHFLFRYLTNKAGLKSEEVELVNSTADQVGTAFVAGKIDYGMTWEPWLSKATERPDGKVLKTSKDEPGIIEDTVVARKDLIQSRREDTKRIMRAFFKAVNFWKNNKDEANAIMAKHFNISVADFAAQMETVKPLDYEENIKKFDPSTSLNIYEITNKAITIYTQDKVLKNKPHTANIIDSSLLKELYK